MINVIRTWKRDGSTNVMSLDAGAGNLLMNGKFFRGKPGSLERSTRVGIGLRGKILYNTADVESLLRQGQRFETPHAWLKAVESSD